MTNAIELTKWGLQENTHREMQETQCGFFRRVISAAKLLMQSKMKMNSYTTIMVLSLAATFMVSCSKSPRNVDAQQPNKISAERIARVLSTTDVHDLSSMYVAMTPDERKEIWLAHIDSIMASNQYTPEQTNQIIALKSMLNGFSFEGISDDLAANELQNWLSAASAVLSNEQIYLLCFTLCDNMDNEKVRLDMLPSSPAPSKPACNCRFGNYFTCMAHPSNCRKIDCDKGDAIGCGWLMLQQCEGKCRLF